MYNKNTGRGDYLSLEEVLSHRKVEGKRRSDLVPSIRD